MLQPGAHRGGRTDGRRVPKARWPPVFPPTHPRPGPSCSAAAPRSPHGAPTERGWSRSALTAPLTAGAAGTGTGSPGSPILPPIHTPQPLPPALAWFLSNCSRSASRLCPARRLSTRAGTLLMLFMAGPAPCTGLRAPRTGHRASGAARGSSRPRTAPGPTAPLAAATRLCPAPRGPKRPHTVLNGPTRSQTAPHGLTRSYTAPRGPLVLTSGCWRLVPKLLFPSSSPFTEESQNH